MIKSLYPSPLSLPHGTPNEVRVTHYVAVPAALPDLLLALVAATALSGTDHRAGRLRGAVRQGTAAPDSWCLRAQRAAGDADRAGTDRRGDDFQPADDGHRRRFRDIRFAPTLCESP